MVLGPLVQTPLLRTWDQGPSTDQGPRTRHQGLVRCAILTPALRYKREFSHEASASRRRHRSLAWPGSLRRANTDAVADDARPTRAGRQGRTALGASTAGEGRSVRQQRRSWHADVPPRGP